MVKSIYINSFRRPVINALPYGTKLYLKTIDNEVREVKIVGGEFAKGKDGYVRLYYKYVIAGLEGTHWGLEDKINTEKVKGSLYTDLECITKGAKDDKSAMYEQIEFVSVFRKYIYKAGDCKSRGQLYPFLYLGGTFNNYAYFKATGLSNNGDTYQIDAEYKMYFDENGWHGCIPAIDKGELYYNVEDALSHYKPKIITFDDCGNNAKMEDEEVTISVKIKKSDIKKLNEICEVL